MPGIPLTTSTAATGPLSNASLVRAGAPVVRPGVAIVQRIPNAVGQVLQYPRRLDPKDVTSDQPAEKIAGDPILQLRRSRPHTPRPHIYTRGQHPEKTPVFAHIPSATLKRQGSVQRSRERLAMDKAYRDRLRQLTTHTVPDPPAFTGLDFYREPRVKPALPGGRLAVQAPTNPVGLRVGTWLDVTTPVGTQARLAAETVARPMSGVKVAPPEETFVEPALAVVPPAAASPEPKAESAGRLVFLVAAVAVAWMVLAHA